MDGGDNNSVFDLETEDAILDHEMMDQLARDDRDLMDLISGNSWVADVVALPCLANVSPRKLLIKNSHNKL